MSAHSFVMSESHVLKVRHALIGVLSLTVLTLAFTGIRLLQTKMHRADLRSQITAQRASLSKLNESAKTRVPAAAETDEERTDAVSRLQTDLERTASAMNCTVSEFQATTDRSPYLSVFTLDTNRPDWEQIPVHVTLNGTLAATLGTLESLRKASSPIEPDSLEIARQSISSKGIAEVALRLSFRVLARAGGKA